LVGRSLAFLLDCAESWKGYFSVTMLKYW